MLSTNELKERLSPDQPAFISNKEVQEILEIGPTTLWRWTKDGGFPAQPKRGKRSRESVRQWLVENGHINE